MTADATPAERRRRLVATAAAIFLVALGARLTFYAVRGPFVTLDAIEYARLARNLRTQGVYSLSTSEPYTVSFKRPPLYPVLLVAIDPDPDAPPTALFVANALLDASVAALVVWLAATFLPMGWAAAAGIAYAVHPGPIPYAAHMLTEIPYTALLAAGAAALVLTLRERPAWCAAAAGLAFGLAALCRPVALLLPFAAAAVVLAYAPRGRVVRAALVVAGAALVVAPWVGWASHVEGRFVPVQSGLGHMAMPASRLKDRVVTTPSGETYDPATRDPAWVAGDALAHPAEYVRQAFYKYTRMFFSGFGLVLGQEGSPRELAAAGRYGLLCAKIALLVLFSILPLALACIGLAVVRRAPAAGVCAALWLYTAAVHLPLWSEYRYWVPATPFLLVGAAAGAHWLSRRVAVNRGACRVATGR
jgi:hypothetical protein